MLPKSLKHTLLLAVAVLVVTTGVAISQLVTHRYSVSLIEGAVAKAQNVAHKLALEAADKILINDLVSLQKMLDDQIASDPSVAYLFIQRDGRLLTHTFPAGVPIELMQTNIITEGGDLRVQKIMSQDGERFIDIAYQIFGGNAGTLRMGISEKPFRQQVVQLWQQMSMITLLILLISIIIGQLVISRLTRPLGQLTSYAKQINEGNLHTQIKVSGRSEVTKLAAAFNSMLSRIQEHTLRLKEYTVRLERKNQELDRAHKQLETSFSISQKIATLSRLDHICQFLVRTLKGFVECEDLSLLVFNHHSRTINLGKPNHNVRLDGSVYGSVKNTVQKHKNLTFIQQPELNDLNLSEWIGDVNQIALFPIWHNELILGAMVVSCKGNCSCIKRELEIVSMILQQAAGAIHRVNTHEEELRELRKRVDTESGFSGIIGKNPKMQLIFKLIEDISPTDATVLILGESGTGKELVASAIHERSHRSGKPFVVINCAAYPSTLLESELFGHEKGAFTGALRRKLGRFEQADGGSVFLDEIGEIDPMGQTKLLRVLQQQTIDRIGGDRPIKVNVRVLAATNKDLLEEVKKGNFREDLFYRLNVIPISLPPLRERRSDIHVLAKYFLKQNSKEQGKDINGISNEAMRILIESNWPGNVRELENSIEHAVVLSKGNKIELNDLPTSVTEVNTIDSIEASYKITESEERLIRETLEACNWNKAETARQLGISRSTLYEKIKRYHIVNPTYH